MLLNGSYDNRSTQCREYWHDGVCCDVHPAKWVEFGAVTNPHVVKPFGYYPDTPWQPGHLLINDIGAQRAVRITDKAIYAIIHA